MTTTIWVSVQALNAGDGSQSSPYQSISEAIDVAAPGTLVLVGAGTYTENVIIGVSGTATAPITVRAIQGPDATVLKPASDDYDTIDIGGADHIVIDGFTIHAPQSEMNGVAVYASKANGEFNTASHVTIIGNNIVGGNGDGIKGSKAEYLTITGNTISGHTGNESAIDFVGVRHAQVTNNRILDSAHHGVIIKGGSADILFENNLIQGTAKSGIEVGGYTELPFYWPGFLDQGLEFEVCNVVVSGNEISHTNGTGLRVVGGQHIDILNNEVHSVDRYLVSIDDSAMYHDTWYSGDIRFAGNSFDRDVWLKNRSEGEGIEVGDNHTDGRDIVDATMIGTPMSTSGSAEGPSVRTDHQLNRDDSSSGEPVDTSPLIDGASYNISESECYPKGGVGALVDIKGVPSVGLVGSYEPGDNLPTFFEIANLGGQLVACPPDAASGVVAYTLVEGGGAGPALSGELDLTGFC